MSEKKNIARAAGVLGAATMLSRIMGMLRDMVVARLFGAGLYTDAFVAAFQIPNMLRRFFAEGALTWWAPVRPEVVERHYSTRVYLGLQHALTSASNHVPFALLDLLLAAVVCLDFLRPEEPRRDHLSPEAPSLSRRANQCMALAGAPLLPAPRRLKRPPRLTELYLECVYQ